ncbi:5'/3'-nucleotidase SurE [Halomarina oriensis]|uniref:5'-nucleotidase SurE n=1 Tax=Halomarina oriensis TaxID=671145 RepID=A0A6B0GNU6_9EURY|nr:5'/3'-nucleotidase SurE [Halomarina oriensis]MWG34353.1 5'/3'-nucleotidase SurE [Halomarina oriensis]
MNFLLTNDDGVESPGLAALRAALSTLGEVTVVAPATDRSGVGRARSRTVAVSDREDAVAVTGTPADCVAYGLRGLDREFDLVVSGCNHGPNVGAYVLGRSGTVGAAMEAGFLGVPAVAVSAYHPEEFFPHPPQAFDFSGPADVARRLVERACEADVFEGVDVLNLNAPTGRPETMPTMRVTRPSADYDTTVEADGDAHHLVDTFWASADGREEAYPDLDAHGDTYPVDSDRHAIVEGAVSVSPLSGPHTVEDSSVLADVVAVLNGA